MCVIRIKKHDQNFVILYKELLENTSVSIRAKGLWAYCMAKPDDWEFHINQLATVLKEGKDALNAAVNELITAGYCHRTQAKDESGKWQPVSYTFFETLAIAEEFKKSLPQREKPQPDNPQAENPQLPRIDSTKDLSNQEQQQERLPVAASKVDNSLKEQFAKTLKEPSLVERAIAYWDKNKHILQSKRNPIGFVITIIRGNEDLQQQQALQAIIEKRKAFVKANEYYYPSSQTGWKYYDTGIAILYGDGKGASFRYDQECDFWNKYGLGLSA